MVSDRTSGAPRTGLYSTITIPTPFASLGLLYITSGYMADALLTAHDAKTDREIYGKHRIDRIAGAFTASPWAYDGKIFCLSEEGVTYVIQAGPDFAVLRKNSLDEVALATPALVRDSLLIRTATKLYRIASDHCDH